MPEFDPKEPFSDVIIARLLGTYATTLVDISDMIGMSGRHPELVAGLRAIAARLAGIADRLRRA